MQKKIAELIEEDIQVKSKLLKGQIKDIESLAREMISTIKTGKKIIIFGNGGSAADSIHLAAELVGRFKKERRAVPAIALTSNISTLTALGNDYDFGYIFERQISAIGRKGDMALGISTSGKSKNVLMGVLKASSMKLKTAVLTGSSKSRLSEIADIAIKVPSDNTPRIQESHITIIHVLCEIVEDSL